MRLTIKIKRTARAMFRINVSERRLKILNILE